MIKPAQTIRADDFAITVVAGEALSARDAVYISTSDGKAYKCDADDATKVKFAGFAQEAASAAANVIIRNHGMVTGFSALSAGVDYYLSGTAGGISTTQGTYGGKIGTALSTTVILISRSGDRKNGVHTCADSASDQSVNITTGFRPGVVRLVGGISGPVWSFGTWVKSNNAAVNQGSGSPGSPQTTTTYALQIYSGTSERWRITITSVTNTGFTLTAVRVSAGNALALYWEAEE